jgi:hypothetical protein
VQNVCLQSWNMLIKPHIPTHAGHFSGLSKDLFIDVIFRRVCFQFRSWLLWRWRLNINYFYMLKLCSFFQFEYTKINARDQRIWGIFSAGLVTGEAVNRNVKYYTVRLLELFLYRRRLVWILFVIQRLKFIFSKFNITICRSYKAWSSHESHLLA